MWFYIFYTKDLITKIFFFLCFISVFSLCIDLIIKLNSYFLIWDTFKEFIGQYLNSFTVNADLSENNEEIDEKKEDPRKWDWLGRGLVFGIWVGGWYFYNAWNYKYSEELQIAVRRTIFEMFPHIAIEKWDSNTRNVIQEALKYVFAHWTLKEAYAFCSWLDDWGIFPKYNYYLDDELKPYYLKYQDLEAYKIEGHFLMKSKRYTWYRFDWYWYHVKNLGWTLEEVEEMYPILGDIFQDIYPPKWGFFGKGEPYFGYPLMRNPLGEISVDNRDIYFLRYDQWESSDIWRPYQLAQEDYHDRKMCGFKYIYIESYYQRFWWDPYWPYSHWQNGEETYWWPEREMEQHMDWNKDNWEESKSLRIMYDENILNRPPEERWWIAGTRKHEWDWWASKYIFKAPPLGEAKDWWSFRVSPDVDTGAERAHNGLKFVYEPKPKEEESPY